MNGNWKQRPEGGGWFAIWLIRTIARRGGRTIARLLLAPITLYFLIVRGPERRASDHRREPDEAAPEAWVRGRLR
mgnify:CR=1 FL=1